MLLQACGGSSALLGGLLGGALRNWGAAALASRAGAQLYSSLPDLQEAPASFSSAPFVQLHPSLLESPVLLRLRERPWGAQAKLTAAEVRSIIGNEVAAPNVGVLRDAFHSFDEPQRPLSQLLQRVRAGGVALATDVSNDPARRVVVDDYYLDAPTGEYVLRHTSIDLLSYLRQNNTHVALVPDVTAPGLSRSTPVKGLLKSIWQSTNEVLMVAPTAFGFNEQAAQDNAFMHTAAKPGEGSTLTRQVLSEFAAMHHQLTEVAGVKVSLFEHSLAHGTPDACFPNNWFSTHRAGEAMGGVQKGTMVLYPMKCPNRAAERRGDIIKVLQQRGYVQTDMSGMEKQKKYFEGTGVLVLDRINGVAYVDISERADESLARQWVESLGYSDLVTFRSTDLRGAAVYHTNVMMAVGTGVAIVCAESVKDAKERNNLLSKLNATHEVVEISLQQMDALCGNALEVQNRNGVPVMAMSTQAYNAFTADQRSAILRHVAAIVHAPIDTLERVGGGGVRCTLAELF